MDRTLHIESSENGLKVVLDGAEIHGAKKFYVSQKPGEAATLVVQCDLDRYDFTLKTGETEEAFTKAVEKAMTTILRRQMKEEQERGENYEF